MSQPIRGQGGLFSQPARKTNMVEDVEILLSSFVEFCSLFSEKKSKMSQPIRGWSGHLVFPIGPKNTNLVENVEVLHPVKFRWILFSGFREEVENVKVYGRVTVRYDNSSLEPSAQVS